MIATIGAKNSVFKICNRRATMNKNRILVLTVHVKRRGRGQQWREVHHTLDYTRALGWILAQVMAGA